MDRNQTLGDGDSARLRKRLEKHLTTIFTNTAVYKYLEIDGYGSEQQIIFNFTDHVLAFPPIKLAYHIWLGMDAADRHAVLVKFHCLYASQPIINTGNRTTLTFCALFMHELAGILVEAMEWPD